MTSESSVYPALLSAERERRSFALGFFFVFLLSVLIGALLFLLFPLAFSDLLLEKIDATNRTEAVSIAMRKQLVVQ